MIPRFSIAIALCALVSFGCSGVEEDPPAPIIPAHGPSVPPRPLPQRAKEEKSNQPALHVSQIEYQEDGSGLRIEVTVVDKKGKGVPGVQLGVGVRRVGGPSEGFLQELRDLVTDDLGTVAYHIEKAPPGAYRTRIVWVQKRGWFHEFTRDGGDPSYLIKP